MVDCQTVQADLSASLDGEPTTLDDDVIEAHLAHCSVCRDFYEKAAILNRRLTIDVAKAPPPDLSETILAEVEPVWRRRATSTVISTALTKLLLVVVAGIYVIRAFRVLARVASISNLEDREMVHLLASDASLWLALAGGLLFAAWKPKLALGMLPTFGALWAFTFGFAARDLVLGADNGDAWDRILLYLAATAILVWTWLNYAGKDKIRRAWESLKATPV